DLTVPSLTAPSVGGAGRDLVVTDTTQNGVLASPAGGSVTRFWLSANSVLDAGDVVLGSRVVPALAAGGSSTANTVVRVPEGVAAGTWYIIAKADADDAMPKELSETNNTKSRTIKIGPDLTVYSFTGPSSAVAGQVITVTVVVKNTGGGDAGASVVRVYFSADAVLDGGDEEVGSGEVGGLAPGASQTCPVVVSVPSGAFPGMWYLIVKADADGEVGETSETNNTRNKTLTVMVP
ncbi:MAG: hypothetical protein N2255_10345, partial [Kiritimatiellae bacterium]|nr:hypothetical protein [Kiritimatiellia bacterium]